METKEKTTSKMHRLFNNSLVCSAPIDEIVNEPVVNSVPAYQLYTSSDVVADALIEHEIEKHIAISNMLISRKEDAIMELFFLLFYTKQFYKKMTSAVIYNPEKDCVKIAQHKNEFIYTVLRNNIARGASEGLYLEDFNRNTIARFILESVTAITKPDSITAAEETSNKFPEEIFGFLINGLVTPMGREFIDRYRNQKGIMSLVKDNDQPFWDH